MKRKYYVPFKIHIHTPDIIKLISFKYNDIPSETHIQKLIFFHYYIFGYKHTITT